MNCNLSAINFVKKNKKQVGVMIIALAMTFLIMYLIYFLFMTSTESFYALFMEKPKTVGYIDLTVDSAQVDFTGCESNDDYNERFLERMEEIGNQLEEIEGIDQVYYTQVLYSNYQAIIGGMGYEFPLLTVEEIPDYLEHINGKLVEGRLPENDGEILVDENVFRNQKMTIGGVFLEDIYGKTFTVSGTMKTDTLDCVGTPQGYTNAGWYLVVLCDQEHSDMTKLLKQIGITPTVYDTIMDSVTEKKSYEDMIVKEFYLATIGIMIVIMVFLTISILVAYVSFMRSRVNEYCLYASIGFSKKEIYGMMMREIGIIFGISLLIGGILSALGMILMSRMMIEPLGLLYRYFYPDQIRRILTSFLIIIGVLQIPIIITINRIKTIDMIEE